MHQHDDIVSSVRRWIETIVVALNLCPFANRELSRDRVCFVVSNATSETALLADLEHELHRLSSDDSIETTLLIHPNVLQNFDDYNQFLDRSDRLLEHLNLCGIYQVASFHPAYQFAGSDPDDTGNFTNRSPYPMLHILREASVERAIADYPDIEKIPDRNIETMRKLGLNRMRGLLAVCTGHARLR